MLTEIEKDETIEDKERNITPEDIDCNKTNWIMRMWLKKLLNRMGLRRN